MELEHERIQLDRQIEVKQPCRKNTIPYKRSGEVESVVGIQMLEPLNLNIDGTSDDNRTSPALSLLTQATEMVENGRESSAEESRKLL